MSTQSLAHEIHSKFSHNTTKLKTSQRSISKRVNKQTEVQLYGEILLNNKDKRTYNDMENSQKYMQKEAYVLCDSIA